MKKKIKCSNCENMIEDAESRTNCPFCNEEIAQSSIISSVPVVAVSELKTRYLFVHLNLQKSFSVDGGLSKIIIGREAYGKELLENIPQISRQHCLLERKGNQFFLSDMGSTHGTFAGVEKIPCNIAREIQNEGFIFLGREFFQVFLPVASSSTSDTDVRSEKTTVLYIYECNACGTVSPTRPDQDLCPKCKGFMEKKKAEE